jgi:hypothetical protein
MLVHLTALFQPPMKSKGLETSSAHPRLQIIAYSPPRWSTLAGHGELECLDPPLLDQPGYRNRGSAHGEVTQLRFVAESFPDGKRVRGRQLGEEGGVGENLNCRDHLAEYKGSSCVVS